MRFVARDSIVTLCHFFLGFLIIGRYYTDKLCLSSGHYKIIQKNLLDITDAHMDDVSGFLLKECYNAGSIMEVVNEINELGYTIEPFLIIKTKFISIINEVKTPINAAEAAVTSCATLVTHSDAHIIVIPTVSSTTMEPYYHREFGDTDSLLRTYRSVLPLLYTEIFIFIIFCTIMVWPTEFDVKLDEYDAMDLPGQQLQAAQAATTLDHILNLNIKAPAACQRLTGIIATMGKSTYNIEVMENMISAGMNIALLNLSFGNKDEHIETIKILREASTNYSIKMGKKYSLAIGAQLPGRKIRTGCIADTYGDSVELITGETVRLTTDETYKDRCSTYTIYIDFMYFAEQMDKGNFVLLDNETIMLKVEMISTTTLTCKILRGGFLGSYKDVFVPNVTFDMPNYTEMDKTYIEMAVHMQLDILVASFVNSANTITELRHLMGEKGKKIAIVANIQTIEGFHNFNDILLIANGIMITRQELGSDISPKKLVIAQKNMVARANVANVPICISAQLLSSMRHNRIPLRAELLDIANCIIDGADALVLSAETAVGEYPVDTVSCMASTCKEAEACIWTKQVYHDMIDKTMQPCDQATGTALSAVLAAQRCLAAAIIVVTTSGKSAQIVSKYRPRCPIIAVTRYAAIARQLHLWRGVIPLVYEARPAPDWQMDLENRVEFCIIWGMERGFLRIGDPVIIVSGWRQGSGFTNTVRITYVTADTGN